MPGRISLAVVFYHPTPAQVQQAIAFSANFAHTIIVDNTEDKKSDLTELFRREVNIQYTFAGKNMGIAAALNSCFSSASTAGSIWLLTMDQDSTFSKKDLDIFLENSFKYEDEESVAVIAPVYHSAHLSNTFRESDAVITSGSLTKVCAWQRVKGFTEALFIDEVDHDFCLRLKMAGFKILQFQNVLLRHELGATSHGSKHPRQYHNAIRLYYIVRNGLWLINKYRTVFPEFITARKKYILYEFKNAVLHSGHPVKCIRFTLLAIYHYFTSRSGSLQQN